MKRKYSIQREGYRTIRVSNPHEAAARFAARIAKKEHNTTVTSKWGYMNILEVPAGNEKGWAVVWRGEDPRVNLQVFLMWDVTNWTFCK